MKKSTGNIMEGLMKYVPFIDFVLEIDREKFIKFINIKKWILLKKKNYPLSDLNKIEQSIITQYKNLLLEKKVCIPQNVANIFAPKFSKQFINLCSDDEEGEIGESSVNNVSKVLETNNLYSNTNRKRSGPRRVDNNEDDDLEFISIDYAENSKEEKETLNKTNVAVADEEDAIDEISQDILSKIDQLTADDIKMKKNSAPDPINYTYKIENEHSDSENHNKGIYERRPSKSDVLFKRRTDFRDEVQVENLINENELHLFTKASIETISLDSNSEGEGINEDGPSSSNNAASLRKKCLEEISKSISENVEIIVEITDSSSSGSNSTQKKVDSLCNSIDSVLPDTNYLMREIEDINNESSKNLCDKQISEGGSDKENSTNPISENNSTKTKNIPRLTPEQISKILEDISSKTDFEWDIFYEALLHVWQMNSGKEVTSETPPPAPPAIDTSLPPNPMQPCFTQQQQVPLVPTLTSHYPQQQNGFPMVMMPRRPKVNINDPRIKKQLQVIQNSPLFTYNVLSTDLAESIRNISQAQVKEHVQHQQQPQIRPPNLVHANNSAPSFKPTHKAPISYGEYKRRQQEKKLEMERQREEERKAKEREEMERQRKQLEASKAKEIERQRKQLEASKMKEIERQRKQLEASKTNEENIRNKLLSTLNPCKEQLATIWSQQRNCPSTCCENYSSNTVPQKDICSKEQDVEKAMTSTKHGKQNSTEDKLNRVYNELKCTCKGFDQIKDFIAEDNLDQSNESMWRNSCISTDVDSTGTIQTKVTPKHIGLRRRSSIHALSAISEQLAQQSSDCSESEFPSNNNSRRRVNNSSENSASEAYAPRTPKRRKTMDSAARPINRATALRIVDDDTSSDDDCINKFTHQKYILKQPIIKLRRISDNFIRKHSKRRGEDILSQNPVAEQNFKLQKTCEVVEILKEPGQKITKVKKLNNDCQMTERTSSFCILCRSKPIDLTNHYIGKHKTESYVSRLSWSELEDLAINIPFAKMQPQNKITRFPRYEVECPFCKETLLDQFINLYNHYSAHTGEYAFQCSHCHLSKPYKPDIQSHILHSKTCRSSSVQIMYRYPPQTLCIYLHYCTICNFVQLNEANILKHLRDHHDRSKAVASNVQKCILAAISDGTDTNQTTTSSSSSPIPTPILPQEKTAAECSFTSYSGEINQTLITTSTADKLQFKIDDDDIPVSNEPCLEDEFFEENKYSLEAQLKQIPEVPTNTNALPLMTFVHSAPANRSKIPNISPAPGQRHLPIQIKAEEMEKFKPSTNRYANQLQFLKKDSVYQGYRNYPPNVNYLGLYKCMTDDCYYSTDSSDEIVKHLTEHSSDATNPNECLQCPYCIMALDKSITPMQLIEHVRTQHGHLNFQCSMCCYRSSTASNVHIHQQMLHNSALDSCKIYKCSSIEKSDQFLNLDEQIAKCIFKISCKVCNEGFYYTKLLISHLLRVHNVLTNDDLSIYSCIYCPLMVERISEIKNHMAAKHPGEQPLVFDHNKQINPNAEDVINSSNVVDVSESVQWTEITPTVCANTIEQTLEDVKPDFKELLRMNEEVVKVRLQKLTAHTGISPDCLYRCPEEICGGFFSNFELWLRHMKERHYTLECKCPHCPTTTLLLPLEQFSLHFELHRRHTFICFYCSTTSSTEALATYHANDKHSYFSSMRLEKIRFNLSYSYSIMIQSDLFQEREKFIAELLLIVDNRLRELENIKLKNLKQQWPVGDGNCWIDDYLQMFAQRRVALRCLVKDCDYRTVKEENLYRHLSTLHTITGTQFKCSKCDYQVEKCNNLDELFYHIKMHNEYIFICVACKLITPSRSKMSAHIEAKHSARDVPVIHLFRNNEQMFIKIYVVFSDNCITFSTMKNCFCCSEQNMGGDVFSLHLKHYHKLLLNYYCEKCTNFSFKSLKEVRPHFEQFHGSENFKISCELAGHDNLNVESINDFKVKIYASNSDPQHIKNEPEDVSDSDVILIEDDDVEIENFVRVVHPIQVKMPQLKCTSLNKLMDPTARPWGVPTVQPTPSLYPSSLMNPDLNHFTSTATMGQTQPQLPMMNTNLNQFSSTTAVGQSPYDHYKLNPITAHPNISINISSNPSSSIATPSTIPSSSHISYSNAILPQNPYNTNISTHIGALASQVQNEMNINRYNLHVPSDLYMVQTNLMQNATHAPAPTANIPYLVLPPPPQLQNSINISLQNPTNNC